MSCRRAFDIDLVAFVDDARAAGWADFRAHYPECAECAAEVRVWTELHEGLHAGGAGASAHPAPERLVEYAERAERLPAGERLAIEAHVGACRLCTDELATLRDFDFAALAPSAVAERPAALQRGASSARGTEHARRAGPVGRLVRHPAFAYAVVLLVLVPVALRERQPSLPPAEERLAKRETVSSDARPGAALEEPEAAGAGGLRNQMLPPSDEGRLAASDSLHDLGGGENERRAAAAPPAAASRAAQASSRDETRVAAAPPPGAANAAAVKARPERRATATLMLRADRTAEVRAADVEGTLRLRVPAVTAGAVQVRIVGPGTGRELRQQFAARPADGTTPPLLDVAVPAAWLVPGAYVVEVSPVDEAAAEAKTDEPRAKEERERLHMKRAPESVASGATTSRFAFTVR